MNRLFFIKNPDVFQGEKNLTKNKDYFEGWYFKNTNKENGTEEYTLTRKGNIGVQTGADILKRHYDFWRPYEFYSFIFGEIAKELLIV